MTENSKYQEIITALPKHVTLIAVSKTKSEDQIMELYKAGHRDFGENYVQELVSKYKNLPKDIRWHFIGHLQTNKVKLITEFVFMIHSVDSLKLLREINKNGQKVNRKIDVLLQTYVGNEETKYGLEVEEVKSIFESEEFAELTWINVKGLMGMASNTDDETILRNEFRKMRLLLNSLNQSKKSNDPMQTLSMGMSGDYLMAIEEGSTMIRIGSLLFGPRVKQ